MMTELGAPMMDIASVIVDGAGLNMMNDRRAVRPYRLTADEKQGPRAVFASLQPFFEIRLDMPGQLIAAFILVAIDEGQSVQYYAERAGVSKSVMSRHIMDLSVQTRHAEPGYGLLVATPHPMELRRHEVFLTEKGLKLARRMSELYKLTQERG